MSEYKRVIPVNKYPLFVKYRVPLQKEQSAQKKRGKMALLTAAYQSKIKKRFEFNTTR